MVWMRMFRAGLCPVGLLCMAFLLAGPSVSAAEREEEKEGGITQAELQSALMGFADTFAATIFQASVDLETRAQSRQAHLKARSMRAYTIPVAIDIAAGPNPAAALLDMVVMVTLTRIVWEEYWRPKVFGDAAAVVIKASRELEGEIWMVAAKVLTPAQQQELRDLIQGWRQAHPEKRAVDFIRFSNLGEARRESTLAGAERSAGFLGIKAATRAADEMRLLAERAMWQMSRLYLMAGFQVDLVTHKILNEPEVEQVTQAIGQFAKMVDELPEKIAEERSATIDYLMKAIAKERKDLITQIVGVVDRGEAEGEDWTDHAFYRGVLLILIFFAAMLVYRFTSEKILGLGQGRRGS